ncbi:MAG: VanZ family protein [candidate division Zixibacteria bacterium]|nr:VanZ family protein [candidate division Zixibacteria bacterium]
MNKSSTFSKRLYRFAWYHLPAILFALVIIIVSSIPNLQAPRVVAIAFDKIAHLLEYAIFSVLIFRSFSHWDVTSRPTRTFLFSALFLSLFAVFDEFYQKLIPGRNTDPLDIIADLSGALLVLIVLGLRRRWSQKASSNCS